MSETDKSAYEILYPKVNSITDMGREDTILSIVASYLAGKEAGKRELDAQKES